MSKFTLITIAIVLMIGSAGALGFYGYKTYQAKQKSDLAGNIAESSTAVPTPSPIIETTKQPSSSDTPKEEKTLTPAPAKTASPVSTASKKTNAESSNDAATPSPTNTSQDSSPAPVASVSSAKIINDKALGLKVKSSGYCKAIAPEDWNIRATESADGADVESPSGNAHSGWWIAYVYSYMFPSIEEYLNYAMPTFVGFNGFRLTSGESDWGYDIKKRDFESNSKKGLVFWKKYDTGDGNYIVSIYFASTGSGEWDSKTGAASQSAAISIRCSTQMRPGTSGNDPSSSSGNSEVSLSDKWREAMMGWENVYSPSTGEHWEASQDSYWNDGPDGAGYYRQVGNDYEKLERGFGEY